MPRPIIVVHHRGRLGNKMFQAMIALELKRRVPEAAIFGLDLPEWGITTPSPSFEGGSFLVTGQSFNLDEIGWLLRSGVVKAVTLDVWGQRLSYFGSPKRYQNLFKSTVDGKHVSDDKLLINIRAEDILTGWHPKYYPLPFSFYDQVINETGLKPVFMGQLDDSPYTQALRNFFSKAEFLPNASVMEDFETLRNARHIVLSISTFSWLATWLSTNAESVHLPVAGLFDPHISGTILLPVDDKRYQFYRVSIPDPEERKDLSLMEWLRKQGHHGRYGKKEVHSLIVSAMARRVIKTQNNNQTPE